MRYDPDANVYYDEVRDLYYYRHGGRWRASRRPPEGVTLHFGDEVEVEIKLPFLTP
jgi:hypothetical protein